MWLTREGRHDGRLVGDIALHELRLREAGEDALGPLPGESRRERGGSGPGPRTHWSSRPGQDKRGSSHHAIPRGALYAKQARIPAIVRLLAAPRILEVIRDPSHAHPPRLCALRACPKRAHVPTSACHHQLQLLLLLVDPHTPPSKGCGGGPAHPARAPNDQHPLSV